MYETGDVSARLTWKDVTVTVALGRGMQTVLEGMTGYADPGTLTALMGPSGSGKSTLLDALASRLAANAFLTGTVLLNGRKAKLSFGNAVSPSINYFFHSMQGHTGFIILLDRINSIEKKNSNNYCVMHQYN